MFRRIPIRTITREEFNNKDMRLPRRKKRKCYSPVQRPRMTPEEYKKFKENGYKIVEEEEPKKVIQETEENNYEWESEESDTQEEEENFEGNYGDE